MHSGIARRTLASVSVNPVDTFPIVPARVAEAFVHIVLATNSASAWWAVALESILKHFTSTSVQTRIVETFVDLCLTDVPSKAGLTLAAECVDPIFY